MFQNLGIALGAGVDEYHRQQDESRKQTAESRADTQFKQQQAQYERQFKQQQAMDAVNAKYAGYREALKKGDYSFADGLIGEYNANQGAWADGLTVQGQSTPQGKVLNFVGQDGKVARSVPVNAQTLSQMLDDAHMTEMKYASPEGFQNAYYKDRTHGLDLRKVGIEETKATDAAAYQQGILGWHNKQAERPQFMQDGTGRVLAISPDGKLLGTYGSPRPVVGHGGGSGDHPLTPQEQATLKPIMDRYSAEQDPVKRAQIGQEYQMAQSYILLGRGKVPNLPGGMVNNPKAPAPVSIKDRKDALEIAIQLDPKFHTRSPEEQQDAINTQLGLPTTLDKLRALKGAGAPATQQVAVSTAPQSRPTADPIAAFRTNRGVDLTSNDPMVRLQAMQEMGQLVADRDRKLGLQPRLTGKEWYYTPQTNK